MTFIYRKYADEDAVLVKRARQFSPYGLNENGYLIEDLSSGFLYFSLGGRGGYPKSTGEPPDYYAIFDSVKRMSIYGLRKMGSEVVGQNEGEIIFYNIESSFSGAEIDLDLFVEALFMCEVKSTERLGYRSRLVGVRLVDGV